MTSASRCATACCNRMPFIKVLGSWKWDLWPSVCTSTISRRTMMWRVSLGGWGWGGGGSVGHLFSETFALISWLAWGAEGGDGWMRARGRGSNKSSGPLIETDWSVVAASFQSYALLSRTIANPGDIFVKVGSKGFIRPFLVRKVCLLNEHCQEEMRTSIIFFLLICLKFFF